MSRQTGKILAFVLLLFFVLTIFAPVAQAAVPSYFSLKGWDNFNYARTFKFWTNQPKLTPQPEPKPQSDPASQPEADPDLGNQTPSSEVIDLTVDEQLMFNLINQERGKAGVALLQVDARLVQSARAKSKDMLENNYFSHTSPTLGSFAALIRQYAPDYRYLGENLAGNRSVQAAHTALMQSDGHRKNILNPKYTHFGIGIVNGGPYGKMFTQHFGG